VNQETKIKARVLGRLINHLDNNKDVQNIDLMTLAKAGELDVELDIEEARKAVYKMDHAE